MMDTYCVPNQDSVMQKYTKDLNALNTVIEKESNLNIDWVQERKKVIVETIKKMMKS